MVYTLCICIYMDSRKILKKLLATLEIEQAIPEVNQEEKAPEQAPINDEIQSPPETDCIPFPEAIKKLYPKASQWSGGDRCNKLLLLGPLTSWPCVCLKGEKPWPILEPNRIDWTITCAKNMDWKRFFNDRLKKNIENRLCDYVKSMVKSGCLLPADGWQKQFPIRISFLALGQPFIISPTGEEIPLLQLIFDTQNDDNECIVCIKNMMMILEGMLETLAVLLGGDEKDVENFVKDLWLTIAYCFKDAMEEGEPSIA